MGAYEQSLAAKLRARECTDLEAAALRIGLKDAQREHELRARPATRSEVAEILLGFSEMLGAEEPGDKGIELYMRVLCHVPLVCLQQAQGDIAKAHRFKRLPNPAEIYDGCRPYMADLAENRSWFRQYEAAVEKQLATPVEN